MKIKKGVCTALVALTLSFSAVPAATEQEASSNEPGASAPSAVLLEKSTGRILFEKNPSEVRYVTKLMELMNLIIAFGMIKNGKISLGGEVKIKENLTSKTKAGIRPEPGEAVKVEDLIKAISMVSSQDACFALAQHISGSDEEGKFTALMNAYASKIGLKGTIFKNCSAEDIDGNVSTAHDIAYMALRLLDYDEMLLPYTSKWVGQIQNGKKQLINTNKFLKTYPGTYGLKTGTSAKAGSCACICAEKNDLNLIAVVLGCESIEERNKEVKNLLDYGFSQYSMMLLTPENTLKDGLKLPGRIKVEGAAKKEAEICVSEVKNFPVENKEKEKIYSQITLKEKIHAPVKQGQKVGEITYFQGKEVIFKSDIITKESVPKKEFFKILKLFSKRFLNFKL